MLDPLPILLVATIIVLVLCIQKPSSAFLWGTLQGLMISLIVHAWIELFDLISR